MGAGAWVVAAAGGVGGRLSPSLLWAVDSSYYRPIARTEDDILWGADGRGALSLGFEPGSGVRIVSGLTGAIHTPDELASPDGRVAVGGRRQLGGQLGASLRLGELLTCRVDGHVPLLQYARGVQLMESWTLSSACRFGGGQ